MPNPITNFKTSDGVDLGDKLITKDYLMSVYPSIAQELGKTPELWSWGLGSSGRLGNASITSVSTPVTTFAGGTNWKQVSCGANHTAAIKTDGTLWTWGSGLSGRLGNASTVNVSTPVTTFAGGNNWKQVSGLASNTAAIKTDGTLWIWGGGGNGKLGNASTVNVSTPVTTFAGGTNWKQISIGYFQVAAIKTDGTLWTWGLQGNGGALGDGNVFGTTVTPVTTFAGGTNWKQVNSGYRFTAAIKTDGTLWFWGNGSKGQTGNATVNTSISTPITTFAGGTNWKQVFCGDGHTAAIKTDGTLWTWGENAVFDSKTSTWTYRPNLGAGVIALIEVVSTPITTFAGGTNWKQVSGGSAHTSAIKTDGTLWVWGSAAFGQLGNAVTTDISTPVTTFAGGNNWKQVSTGGSHTAAIKSADFI